MQKGSVYSGTCIYKVWCLGKIFNNRVLLIYYNVQTVKQFRQETLLLQRNCARHLSVAILQLQNISLEKPIDRVALFA